MHTLYRLRGYGYPNLGSNSPSVPDPTATIAASNANNQSNANFNNALTHGNTSTPLGSQTYTSHVDPTTGAIVYDQTQALSSGQQGLLDAQTGQSNSINNIINGTGSSGMQEASVSGLNVDGGNQSTTGGSSSGGLIGQVADAYANPLDTSGLPKVYGADDLLGARQQVQDALYQRQAQYLDPQYSQLQGSLDSKLANQGITQGSEAYNNAYNLLGDQREKAYADARDSSIAGGTSELSTLANLSTQQRQQALAEALTQRNEPASELANLRAQTAPTIPSFTNASNASTSNSDLAAAIANAFNGQQSQANAASASNNSVINGLFGLAGDYLTSSGQTSLIDKLKGLFKSGSDAASPTVDTPNVPIDPNAYNVSPDATNAVNNAGGAGTAIASAIPDSVPAAGTVTPELLPDGSLQPTTDTVSADVTNYQNPTSYLGSVETAGAAGAGAAGLGGLLGAGSAPAGTISVGALEPILGSTGAAAGAAAGAGAAATGATTAGTGAAASTGTGATGVTAGAATTAAVVAGGIVAAAAVLGKINKDDRPIGSVVPQPGTSYDGKTLSTQTSDGSTFSINAAPGTPANTENLNITGPTGQNWRITAKQNNVTNTQAAGGPYFQGVARDANGKMQQVVVSITDPAFTSYTGISSADATKAIASLIGSLSW